MGRIAVFTSAGLLGLVLFSLAARVTIDGRALLLEGEAREQLARQHADSAEALLAARRYAASIRCYLPFTAHGRRSIGRLAELGIWLDERGERTAARRVWHQGLSASRSLDLLYHPYESEAARLSELLDRSVVP